MAGTVRSISYPAFRANLKKALDEVCSRHEPLRVERQDGEAVLVVCAADFSGLAEAAYLLRSPENARRLLKALYGDRSTDREFASADELRAECGLGR